MRLGIWVAFFFSFVSFEVGAMSPQRCGKLLMRIAGVTNLSEHFSLPEFTLQTTHTSVGSPIRLTLTADPNLPPITAVYSADFLRFATPKGERVISLVEWENLRNMGKLLLLHRALNTASLSMKDVLNGIESPQSLAQLYRQTPLRPSLADVVSGSFTQSVLIEAALHRLKKKMNLNPTLEEVVNTAADYLLDHIENQVKKVKEIVTEPAHQKFVNSLEATHTKVKAEIADALLLLISNPEKTQAFNRNSTQHLNWVQRIVNRYQGDSGEMMFAVRVDNYLASGILVRNLPPDRTQLQQAKLILLNRAYRYYWLKHQLMHQIEKAGINTRDPLATQRFIDANSETLAQSLKESEPTDFELALNSDQRAEAVQELISSRMGVPIECSSELDLYFQKVIHTQAQELQQNQLRKKIENYLAHLIKTDPNYHGADLQKETERFMSKEIDLLYADSQYWAEVKNYSEIIDYSTLIRLKNGDHSILDQAIDNLHLARAIMGPEVRVYQFSTQGFTLEAAVALEKAGITIAPSSIIIPSGN